MWREQRLLPLARVALVLVLATAAHAQVAYDVVNLHPSGAESSFALRVSDGQQVGDAISGACLWFGTAESVVDLEPPGYEWCEVCDVSNGQQVGGGGTATFDGHALLWYGSADSIIDLHPSGFVWSICEGVGDGQQVGYGVIGFQNYALLWEGSVGSVVNLHPSGFEGSFALDAAGGQQVGVGFLELTDHALLWSGTSGSVIDLHPVGFSSSWAQGGGQGQQVGRGFTAGGAMHALLWSGSAGSVVDLHPSGFEGSEACDVAAGYQVGTGWLPGGFQGQGYALRWSGTAESVMNLHSFLPSEYIWSRADGIDSSGCIVGVARTETTGHSVMWVPRHDEDTDGDGLLDDWETNGIDIDGDGEPELDLPALGADPMHKDLFVEVDAMEERAPSPAALNRVIAAFAAAPNGLVDNPDRMDGITLHIQLDETDIPRAAWPDPRVNFSAIKNNDDPDVPGGFGTRIERRDPDWRNIRAAKMRVYRYCIFADRHRRICEDGVTVDWNSLGAAEQPGNDFFITLGGEWRPLGGTEDQQAGMFMHELGHNLNLGHGGGDKINFKPNYHSVMNYHWGMPSEIHVGWVLDYSREALPTLDESNLSENDGIGGTVGVTVPVGPPPAQVAPENGPVDWNRDRDTLDTGVSADINYFTDPAHPCWPGPSPGQELRGHCDWPALWYTLGGHPNFERAAFIETMVSEEMTYEMYRTLYGRISVILDLEPDALNLSSQGKFVTAYIEGPGDFDVSDIQLSSLKLNESVPALSKPTAIGDHDGDNIADLMVKFDRQQVAEVLGAGAQMVQLTGQLSDGKWFAGHDMIKVLDRAGDEKTETDSDITLSELADAFLALAILDNEFIFSDVPGTDSDVVQDQPSEDKKGDSTRMDKKGADSDEEPQAADDNPADPGVDEEIVSEKAALSLAAAAEAINLLDPECFRNKNSAAQLTNAIGLVFAMVEDGLLDEALGVLANEILERTNGCAVSGKPDENDWIRTPEGQGAVYPLVAEAIELLESLL